ncbi:glycosyltransferase family 28 domain-containing protein [Colletotrichum falcatum]|nr:glycosyltransferase family 28 domain-containing protein [Colletotrichum falcatum]
MSLSRVTSKGLGHIQLGNSDRSDTATTGNVGNDGRVKVRFHENPQALAAWFRNFQGAFRPPPSGEGCGEDDDDDDEVRRRRRSSVVLENLKRHPPPASPRLNIAILVVGSRGDVQPFIPIAQLLAGPPYGHRVRICTHPVFKEFVESNGVDFFSIGGDPEALMAYMVKNPGLLPSRESVRAGDVGQRRREMAEIIDGAWRSCIEAGDGTGQQRATAATVANPADLFVADAIIANPPSMAHIHCAEKLGVPLHMVFTMPWCPTQAFHHPLASMSYGEADKSVANYLSFIMMELLTWQGLGDLINKFRTRTLGLDPISPMWGCQLLPRLRVPYTFLWSESLIPKPDDWDSHINITGFSFLPLADKYAPPADLAAFLESGPPPVYIGFGSIVVDDPKALTRLIFKAVEIAGVRAVVSKGWGGVGGGGVPDGVYLVGNCPHDWLFQRVSAVVHHGGAGTSAAGIAAGRPTVVVPFFGDQPFWGQMIARAGAGPAPVPFKEMTAETLASSIAFALRPEVQVAVRRMAQRIAEEDGAGDTARDIQERLALDTMRCDVCPERLAVWRHRKTGAHLSSFAVSCLVDRGHMKPHDFKLLKHRHWYVDEGAEHPIIGLVAAVAGFLAAVGTATSDYSARLRGGPQQRPVRVLESDIDMDLGAEPGRGKPADEEANTTREASVEPGGGGGDGGADPDPDPAAGGHLKQVARGNTMTPRQMNRIAVKMATKSLRCADPAAELALDDLTASSKRRRRKRSVVSVGKRQRSRPTEVARATARYGVDVAKAGLKAPVAVLYNVANGFHNYPSYGFAGHEVRRRDEITGLGSGLRTAAKEFALGGWDAFSGVVAKPYKGAREGGVKGFGKGCWQAGRGFTYNIFAALFGLPGYTLKGLEKELSKHGLTELKAEVLLIRLRRGMVDFRESTEAEREEVIVRWQRFLSARP